MIGCAGATAIQSAIGNQTLAVGSGSTVFNLLAGLPNRAVTIESFNPAQDFVQLQGYATGSACVVAADRADTLSADAPTIVGTLTSLMEAALATMVYPCGPT